MNTIRNLAQGCLLGALIGDAAGSRLEFLGRKPTQADVAEALAIKGGGVFGLAPGQITDDGEMTLALARSLVGSLQFPRERVAANYRAWVASNWAGTALSISRRMRKFLMPKGRLACSQNRAVEHVQRRKQRGRAGRL